MDDEQEIQKAQSRYNSALKRIQSGLDARNGGPGAEAELSLAYQDLVRLNVVAQLNLKYVRGKALKQVR